MVHDVHYLPKESGANYTIMQYVDRYIESVIKFGVLKDEEIDFRVTSVQDTSEDQSRMTRIENAGLLLDSMMLECDVCRKEETQPSHGCVNLSILSLICKHKLDRLAEQHNLIISPEELLDNIQTKKILEKLLASQGYKLR